MATNAHIYMSVYPNDGDDDDAAIKGESTDYFYEGDIVVDGWGWDLVRRKTPVQSEDGVYVGATAGVFKFSKMLDTATTELLGYLERGERLSSVEINMTQHVLEEAQSGWDFGLTLTLNDVFVVSYSLDAEGEFSMTFKESWELEYRAIMFDYLPYEGSRAWTPGGTSRADGSAVGAGTTSLTIPRVPDYEAEDKKKQLAGKGDAAAGGKGDTGTPGGSTAAGGASRGGTGAGAGGAAVDLDALWDSSRQGHQGEGVAQPRRNG